MISSSWRQARDEAAIREMRSGLSGFGRRPALHPTWREPAEGVADAAEDAVALVLAPAGPGGPERA